MSSFSFTNVSDMSVTLTPTDIKPVTNYALVEQEPENVGLKNKTCVLGQGELLSYQCQELKKVPTKQTVYNPPLVPSGVQYVVRLDELLRTETPSGVVDDPIVMYLTVRHPVSGYVTADHIATIFKRLLGAVTREDGTLRFDDLMISALQPTRD